VVSLDREERGQTALSAVQEVQQAFSIPVVNIITLTDLIDHLETVGRESELAAMRNYNRQWGVEKEA